MKIGSFVIDCEHKPFIIAEMSGNHNQSLERALAIVDAAADSGVQALKIQTYTADTMTLDIKEREFFLSDPKGLWTGKSLYQLYQEAYTPWEWHKPIFDRCRERGVLGFSTPFDATSVAFLANLDVPVYKIASFENIDLPLLKLVAQQGKPVIMSTGMASVAELSEAVGTLRKYGCSDIVLLKCTSSYPASPEDSNIRTIPHMKELFGCEVGLSDHTLGVGVAVASIALGARVIEKHFTLNRAEGGVDSAFSLEPIEMASLVDECGRAFAGLGHINYERTPGEIASLAYRRSLYVVEDVRAGEALTGQNIRAIRPGLGLSPKFYDDVVGKTAAKDITRGTALSWDMVQ